MTDNWDRTQFDRDLKAILESKLPVSASKITGLQALATAHPKHHNYIVQCITRFIETAPPDYRLAGLYVIDAISRAVHKQQRKREENNEGPSESDGYLKRFAIVLKDDALNGCFEPCSTKDKEKVKKTLDFWEQGNVYSKDMVQYVKRSFLNSGSLTKDDRQLQQQSAAAPPPVDTASLLATLSNIGNGSLANLNIPGLTPTPPAAAAPVTTTPEVPEVLPPALAKLLGGLVSTPSPTPPVNSSPASIPPSDPRVRATASNTNSDPRQRPVRVPQGPSIPLPAGVPSVNSSNSASTRAPGERKSRWGSANETPANNHSNNNFNNAPLSLPPQQQQQQDPWSQRQHIQDPRLAMNQHNNYQPNNNNNNNNRVPPPYQQQQSYPPPYQQQQQQQSYQQPSYQPIRAIGAEPVHDPSLPPGSIKVLTRTLFVGPIPDHYEKEDVAHLFSKYGELASVIVSKKLKGRHNAFLKFTTRACTEAAKYDSAGLVVEGVPVKVNWAFGFGPKKHFNYDRGDSIIPLAELSPDEKDNLMTAPVGGFQGQPVVELMTVEEPEAQYRPEWKNENNTNTSGFKRGGGGSGRTGANFEEINTSRKRSRFGPQDPTSPPRGYGQQQQQQEFNPQQGFYQQQQQYDPAMAANQYHDHQ